MKKNGLRIALALVIALVFILGSIGAVSAARGGHAATISPSISVSITSVTAGTFDIAYSWDGQSTFGYYITIKDITVNDLYDPAVYCSYTDFGSSINTFSVTDSISSEIADPTHAYTIGLHLAKNNGDIFKCAYSTWQPPL